MKKMVKKRIIFLYLVICLVFIGFISSLELIVDNTDSKFNTPAGTWNSFANACGYNGDYKYETDALPDNRARWNLTISVEGNYSVYAHYCVHSARPTAVPFTIRHADGLSFTNVDETKDASGASSGDFTASGWKLLGTYKFNLTSTTLNQFVRLNSSSTGDTCADAVKIVLVGNPAQIYFVDLTESGLLNRNNFFVNVSASSPYLTNITLNLYNEFGNIIDSVFSATDNLEYEFTGLNDGVYYYNASAYDLIGNVNSTETRNVTIDTTSPSIIVNSPLNIIYNNKIILINFTADSYQSLWYYNGTENISYLGEVSVEAEEGNNTFVFYANDSAGNFNYTLVEFSIDSCIPNMINSTYSEWDNLSCVGIQKNQSRYFVEYDSNNCEEIGNTTYYEYQLVGPELQNDSWSDWTNISCLLGNTMNQTRDLIQFDIYGCGLNETIFDYQNVEFCDYCIPNMQNTTETEWINQGSCNIDDLQLQNRSKVNYDTNNCGEVENTTIWEYQNVSCNYCSYNPTNITGSWTNVSCLISDLMNQSQEIIEYDSNYVSCYAVTGLPSDLWNNGLNNTYFNYMQTLFCDYCTPNLINTTISDWSNLSCSSTQMNQSRSWIEYDNNTCGEVSNTTYYEYQLVGPIYQNTSWSNWYDVTSCQLGDYYVQEKNLTQYDDYICAINQTFFEYQNQSCDYCNPSIINSSWGDWSNTSVCYANNSLQQTRNLTQYDSNNCVDHAIVNQTFYEYQIIKCDYDGNPIINILSPLNIQYNNKTQLLNISVIDSDVDKIWYNWNSVDVNYVSPEYIIFNEGNNSLTAYSNDSYGNINSVSVIFNIDTTKPLISITYPVNNGKYRTNVAQLKYTVSDTNLQSCWYSLNGGITNISIICGVNVTGLNPPQGNNTWTVWANDSVGNVNSSSVTFLKDTIKPSVTIISPQNIIYGVQQTDLNFFVSDANLQSCGYSTNGGATNITTSCTANKTGLISNEGVNNWLVYARDLAGNRNFSLVTFFVDTTFPLIDYETGTEDDEKPVNRNWIYVNVSVVEVNEANITFVLMNPSSIVNQTTFTTQQREITWNNLPDGNYTYYATVCDIFSRCNSTATRKIIIDTVKPDIENLRPIDGYIFMFNNVNISAYAHDPFRGSGINFSSVIMELNSVPVVPTINPTGSKTISYNAINLSDGVYTINITLSDYAGNLASAVWFFEVNTSLLSMNIYSPLDGKYYNTAVIPWNITLGQTMKILQYSYPSMPEKRVILCTNCNEFGNTATKLKLFGQGWTTVIFKAMDSFGNIIEQSTTFFVDSKPPISGPFFPRANSIVKNTPGNFTITYSEVNLKNITLYYTDGTTIENITRTDCVSGINKLCSFYVDLNAYDLKRVTYWFVLEDGLNTARSINTSVNVDVP